MVKKFSNLADFAEKHRQFPEPTLRENLNFPSNGTQWL
jgi:hypothetical protein